MFLQHKSTLIYTDILLSLFNNISPSGSTSDGRVTIIYFVVVVKKTRKYFSLHVLFVVVFLIVIWNTFFILEVYMAGVTIKMAQLSAENGIVLLVTTQIMVDDCT
jgi:hypothetical protein